MRLWSLSFINAREEQHSQTGSQCSSIMYLLALCLRCGWCAASVAGFWQKRDWSLPEWLMACRKTHQRDGTQHFSNKLTIQDPLPQSYIFTQSSTHRVWRCGDHGSHRSSYTTLIKTSRVCCTFSKPSVAGSMTCLNTFWRTLTEEFSRVVGISSMGMFAEMVCIN